MLNLLLQTPLVVVLEVSLYLVLMEVKVVCYLPQTLLSLHSAHQPQFHGVLMMLLSSVALGLMFPGELLVAVKIKNIEFGILLDDNYLYLLHLNMLLRQLLGLHVVVTLL